MKKYILCLLALSLLPLSISCGPPEGGNTQGFSTVYVYANYDEEELNADAYVELDNDSDGTCDIWPVVEEEITVSVTVTEHENLPEGVETSAVQLTGYTVSYTPFENSPAVTPKTRSHNMELKAGASTEIVIRIIDHEDKRDASSGLSNCTLDAARIAGTAVSFEYTVTVTLYLEEVTSGIEEEVSVNFPMTYLNLVGDDDSDCVTNLPRPGC